MQRVATKSGSVLDQLRVLSEHLCNCYPWQKGQATAFVLTGLAPFVPGIRAVFHPHTARFSLDVHLAVTPRQLADRFRQVKKDLLQLRRTKQLQVKHMQLATYADSTDWKKSIAKWNQENKKKEMRYKDAALFRRDALKARERLLVTVI